MNQKPKLIIVTGRPGSGKTTLSKKLAALMKYPVFCRDEFKEGYVHTFGVKHTELPEDANKKVTDAFFASIDLVISNNVSVIVEAAFQHKVWDAYLKDMKERCDMSVIICQIDDNLAAERHLQRGLDDPNREYFHGDPRVTHYKKTGEMLGPSEYTPPNLPCKTIEVSTENGYLPTLKEVARELER